MVPPEKDSKNSVLGQELKLRFACSPYVTPHEEKAKAVPCTPHPLGPTNFAHPKHPKPGNSSLGFILPVYLKVVSPEYPLL